MISTSSPPAASSPTLLRNSQQQWDKKRRSSAVKTTTAHTGRGAGVRRSNNNCPSDYCSTLFQRSPFRMRLLSDGGGEGNPREGAAAVVNKYVGGGDAASATARTSKLYLPPKMTIAIKNEIESLPLPASLAAVATTLLNSTEIWDAYDSDEDSYDHVAAAAADPQLNSYIDNEKRSGDHYDGGDDDYDLSKYFEGITITDELHQKQQMKLQFDNRCKGFITIGNHVLLMTWMEVKDKLGGEFLFAVVANEEESLKEEGDQEKEGEGDVVAKEENDVSAALLAAGTDRLTPMSKQRRKPPRKFTPKTSHHTSPKRTQQRDDIKLKRVWNRFTSSSSGLSRGFASKTKKVVYMGLDAYKHKLLDVMGKSKYNEMFQQATISPTTKHLLLDDAAIRLDERIALLESQRRKTKQDELLEKAERDREARESASKLLRQLTPEEEQIVKNAIYGIGRKDDILASHDADSVQRESMHRLQPGQWLNDEVINYFLKNCLAKRDEKLCAKQPGRKRSHFFNSFFVQTMFDEKNSNHSLRGKYNYKNVKRWSKKVPGKDIFNLKYIFVPINLDNTHWTSACIFMELKKIQYYDSLGGTDWRKLEGLLQYVKDEWKAKRGGEEIDVSEWELVRCSSDTPRQLNGVDCGVFTCMFADFVTKDCEPVFNQTHINQCRQRIALSIMKNCAIE